MNNKQNVQSVDFPLLLKHVYPGVSSTCENYETVIKVENFKSTLQTYHYKLKYHVALSANID